MFFFKKKRKKGTLSFSNIECVIVETRGMHFELIPTCQIIKYRNVISPRDGGLHFPDGYFDEKETTISENDIGLISTIFDRMFQTRTPENELSSLPFGATRDAYMRIILKGNKTAYYSNTHLAENGFGVEYEVVASEFTQIVQLLERHCAFPRSVPEVIPVKPMPVFLNKTDVVIESANKTRLIGYRFDSTGIFGYDFYKADVKICTVSSVVIPSPPVMIYGNGVNWRSDFKECTIVPGLTRTVNDEVDGKQVCKIVYIDRGHYIINESISVFYCEGKYAFYSDQTVIATIHRIIGKNECPTKPLSQYDHREPCFEIDCRIGIKSELMMVILALPMLQFGL